MRTPRIVIPDLPHHVVLRGNNRRRIFSYPREYELFLFFLARALSTSKCALHAAALMTNHVHLLVTPPTVSSLARFVKGAAQRYSQTRNLVRGGSGRLFDARYFSKPVLTDEQLAVTTSYIELNPVQAGMVDDPARYRWTTYAWHAGQGASRIPRKILSPTGWYESLGATKQARESHYRTWVDDCRTRDVQPKHLSEVEIREAAALLNEKRRLERPDRSSAG